MTLFEKSAILKHQNGGPHGLGEPEDRILNFSEKYQILPAFLRDILVRDLCSKWNEEYIDCCENNYWTKALGGRRKLFALKSCLKKCWDLPHVKEQAEEEYLFERSTFRLTGLKKSHREKLSHSKSEQNQSLDE